MEDKELLIEFLETKGYKLEDSISDWIIRDLLYVYSDFITWKKLKQ
jgi:hypothetical protein